MNNKFNIYIKSEKECVNIKFSYEYAFFDWVDAIKNGKGRKDRQSGFHVMQILYNNGYFDVTQTNICDKIEIEFTVNGETGKYLGEMSQEYENSFEYYELGMMQVQVEQDMSKILDIGNLFTSDYIISEVVSNIEKYCKNGD